MITVDVLKAMLIMQGYDLHVAPSPRRNKTSLKVHRRKKLAARRRRNR